MWPATKPIAWMPLPVSEARLKAESRQSLGLMRSAQVLSWPSVADLRRAAVCS
jgi:hypothetical protein